MLCLFSGISLLLYFFISFLSFIFLLCLPTLHFISLLFGCLKPSRDHNASFTLCYHFSWQRQRKEYSFHFLFLLFPFAPRLFPCCLLWFQNVFSLHEILLILFSLVFSFVTLTFKKNGWRNSHFSYQICASFISWQFPDAFHLLSHVKG